MKLKRFSKANPWRSRAVVVRDSVQSFAQPPKNGLIDKPWPLDSRMRCHTFEYSVDTSFATNLRLLKLACGVIWVERSCNTDR